MLSLRRTVETFRVASWALARPPAGRRTYAGREFVAGAILATLAARAEQRIPRIGCLGPAYADKVKGGFGAFRAGLSDLGYVEGRNVEIESRFWVRQEEEAELRASSSISMWTSS
jgi:hypothetical protein